MRELIERLQTVAAWSDKDAPGFIRRLASESAAALEAAREDAERLDWLSQLDIGICHLGYGDYQWYAYAKPAPEHGKLGLRAAIDQARGGAWGKSYAKPAACAWARMRASLSADVIRKASE